MIGAVIGASMLGGCSEKHEANDTLPSASAAETTEALPALGPPDFPVPDEARTKDDEEWAEALRATLDDGQIDGSWSLHLAAAGRVVPLVAAPERRWTR